MDVEVSLDDMVEIVRETRDIDILKEYGLEAHGAENNNAIECAMCGEETTSAEICSNKCIKETVETLVQGFSPNLEFVKRILAVYARNHRLANGTVIMYPGHGYRNEHKVFWDAKNERIVPFFTEIDDYGSVPPIFPVGNGDFDPTTWLHVVDHNTFVFPNEAFIREMKAYATNNPDETMNDVVINGRDYIVEYDPEEMKGQWYSAFLEVDPYDNSFLKVYPGNIEWREDFMKRIRERKAVALLKKRPNEVPLPNNILENIGRRYLGGRLRKTVRKARKLRKGTRRRR
jgi:hypothetical protein